MTCGTGIRHSFSPCSADFDLAVAGIQGFLRILQLLPPPLLPLLILLLIAADAQQLRVYHVVQLPLAAARQSMTAKQIRTS